VVEHSVLPGTGVAPDVSKELSAFIFEGLELNKNDFVLNQPPVTAAGNMGSRNMAGGPRANRASDL
jgi:hypothetical protein